MGPIGGTSSPSVLDLILENGNEMNIEILSILMRAPKMGGRKLLPQNIG